MWMIAGLPGKLKSLMDRLTATRAANLDNLNATITSRAPAATALSNAVWSDARAAKLDGIERAITAKAITSIVPMAESALLGVGTHTIVSITGQGVLNLATAQIRSGSSSGTSSGRIQLVIDGVTVNGPDVVSSGVGVTVPSLCVGLYSNNGTYGLAALDQVPFYSSLQINLIVTGVNVGGGGQAVYAYRRTG